MVIVGLSAKASAETTEDMVQKKVRSIQRAIAWTIKKELYFTILKQAGFTTPKKLNSLNLQITFVTPNIVKIQPTDVLNAFNAGLITRDEAREYLKSNGLDMDFADDSGEVKPMTAQPAQTPTDDADNNQIPIMGEKDAKH